MLPKTEQIEYVQGIRGICCLWVGLFHFLLSFLPYGYVGWGSGIEANMQQATYFAYFPYSAFLNSSFPLYVLISLIGFTVGCKYFTTKDIAFLRRQGENRYLRLMFPVLAITLISYAIYACSLNYNILAGAYTDGSWLVASTYAEPISLAGAIFSGLFRVFFLRDGDYCAVLWCYHIIFLGSFMVYGFLALFGTSKSRYAGYLLLSIGLWYTDNTYFLWLIAGMIAADLVVHNKNLCKEQSYLGVGLVIIGILLGYFPAVLLPSNIDESMISSVGIVFLLIGIEKSRFLQQLLSRKTIVTISQYGSAIVLVHMCVLTTITSYVYYKMELTLGHTWLSPLVTFLTFVIFTFISCRLFYRWIECPLLKLSNKGSSVLSKLNMTQIGNRPQ